MTKRMFQLIREYRAGIINRVSFIYGWRKEFDLLKALEEISKEIKNTEIIGL